MARACFRVSVALGAALVAAPVAAEMRFHYDCRVVHTERIPYLGRQGQTAELSHFKCRVSGGLLDGFVATGTNILEPHERGAQLVGSTVIAQKADSTLAYEVNDATRRLITNKGGVVRWESTGTGVYRRATGSAAPLAGKPFTALVRSAGPRAFTIDTVVGD